MLAMQLHVFKGELLEVRGGIADWSTPSPRLRCGHGVEVAPGQRQRRRGWRVQLADGSSLSARAWCWPARPTSRRGCGTPAPHVAAHLTGIEYSRIDYVYLRLTRAFRIATAIGLVVSR